MTPKSPSNHPPQPSPSTNPISPLKQPFSPQVESFVQGDPAHDGVYLGPMARREAPQFLVRDASNGQGHTWVGKCELS
jgi:hypothetical protein